jgi:hypothetical protein
MPLRSESTKTTIGDNGKFMVHHLNHVERGARPEALSDHYGLADDSSVTVVSSHPDGNLDGTKPMGFSAIGIALLSLAAMVGVRMRRGMQSAVAFASSDGHGTDMSIPMATVPSDNSWDLKSQCPPVRTPEKICNVSEKALAHGMHADINSPFALWDPLGLGNGELGTHVKNIRESEMKQSLFAMSAVYFISPQKPGFLSALPAEQEPKKKGGLFSRIRGGGKNANEGNTGGDSEEETAAFVVETTENSTTNDEAAAKAEAEAAKAEAAKAEAAKAGAAKAEAAKAEAAKALANSAGMAELDGITLARQTTALESLAAEWSRRREFRSWEDSRMTGFSEQAEIINGRMAMFFLVVGLLTEYWTDQSIPDQIFTMLRVGSFIGPE